VIVNILFICIGNICRSPMAEGLFRQAMPEKAVYSAGLNAMVGEPADPSSIQLMLEHGIDITGHRARSLAAWMVKEADLILTMDREQKRFIEQTYAKSKGKVMRLGEGSKYDIPDPYQLGSAAFRHSCDLIAQSIDELVERIVQPDKEQNECAITPIRESPLPFSPQGERDAVSAGNPDGRLTVHARARVY
jgi:protein-tyrosine phosphatase